MNPIFIDIDGTLTMDGRKYMDDVVPNRIERVKEMIAAGIDVVIWSATGTEYAKRFCAANKIYPLAAIGKPHRIIDDSEDVVEGGLKILNDDWLDQ